MYIQYVIRGNTSSTKYSLSVGFTKLSGIALILCNLIPARAYYALHKHQHCRYQEEVCQQNHYSQNISQYVPTD